MVFHWSLSDSKSPRVSRTLLSILDVLNNAVVWMVSTCPPTSKSSSPFNYPLITVPKAPITIGIIVTFMIHSYYYHYYSFKVFHVSVSWWFITGVYVTASFLKSPGLWILAILSNAVIWIMSPHPPTSKSSRPFNNLLVIVLKAPIKIGTIVTFMFHIFFNSLAMSRYLSFFSHSFRFILWSAGTAKSTILQILFFLLIIIRSGLLAGIRWSVCMLKSHRGLCVSFSGTNAGLCIYHLFVWSNLNFFHISQWITLPTQSCLALYSFCASLLHSLIMWLIVSSLSLHTTTTTTT